MSFDSTDTYSFFLPCLNWKFILAYKGHSGFNGFVAPYRTKYLHRRERFTTTETLGGVVINGPIVVENEFDIDPLTGNQVSPAILQPQFPFPFAAPPDPSDGAWVVRDDYYSHTTQTISQGPQVDIVTRQVEVWLTNPYTVAQMDADTDALIASISPDSVAWGTLAATAYDPASELAASSPLFLASLMPAEAAYQPLPLYATPPALSVFTIAELKAAAWYTYLPSGAGSLITPNYDAPGWYAKLAGFFRMAGKYCERTQYVDYAANAVGQPVCVSGIASCGTIFKVTAPPIVEGQDGYKLIVPGRECG